MDKVLTLPRAIICEGPDDLHFLKGLIEKRALRPFHLRHTGTDKFAKGGISKFGDALDGISAQRGFGKIKDIVLIADADGDRAANFKNIVDQVSAARMVPPIAINTSGGGRPAIWIVILPFEGVGTLETYCLEAARSVNATLAAHSDTFRALVTKDQWPQPKSDKLWLRAMLAGHCKTDPMVSFGMAITHAKFNCPIPFDHKSFNGLVNILMACG